MNVCDGFEVALTSRNIQNRVGWSFGSVEKYWMEKGF